MAEYDDAAPRRRAARRAGPDARACSSRSSARNATACDTRRVSSSGSVRGRDGPGCLAGQPVLFYWPADGWFRGTVVRRSPAAGHSHFARYDRQSALGAVVADSLRVLDAASHVPGGRWALVCPVRWPPGRLLALAVRPSRRAGEPAREERELLQW